MPITMIQGQLNGLDDYTAKYPRGVRAHWAPATVRMYQATLAGRTPGPFARDRRNPAEWGWVWYLELAAIRAKYQGEG